MSPVNVPRRTSASSCHGLAVMLLTLSPHPHFPGLNATAPRGVMSGFLTAVMWSSSENTNILPFLCTDLIREIVDSI